MKKFSKILMIIASVCLLAAVMALAISANTEETVQGQFAVRGTDGVLVGYDTWAEAKAAAAASDNVIIVNEDWVIDENEQEQATPEAATASRSDENVTMTGAITVIGDLTIDLNGKTVTQNFDGVVFKLWKGHLTLTGGGTLKDIRTLVSSGSSGTNMETDYSTFTIDTKKPIDIYPVAKNAEGIVYNTFYNYSNNNTDWNFKGAVNIYPVDAPYVALRLEGARNIKFDHVNFKVAAPSGTAATAPSLNTFLWISDMGMNIDIINSELELAYGIMFDVKGKNGACIDLTGWLDRWPVHKPGVTEEPAAMKQDIDNYLAITADKQLNINATGSSIVSLSGKEYASSTSDYAGSLMRYGTANMNANFDNCYLQGGSRVFSGDSNGASNRFDTDNKAATGEAFSKYYLSPARLTFKDCDFVRNSDVNNRAYLFVYSNNVIWDGGSINNGGKAFSGVGYYHEVIRDGAFWYGMLVKNTVLDSNYKPAAIPADTSSDGQVIGWSQPYTYEGTVYQNYKYLENGAYKTAPYMLTTVAPQESVVASIATGYGVTADWESYYDANKTQVKTGTNDFESFLRYGGAACGVFSEEFDSETGNVYAQIAFDGTTNNVEKYYEIKPNGQYIYGGGINQYAIIEFDIASGSENQWFDKSVGFTPQTRANQNRYKADGTLIGAAASNTYNQTVGITLTPDGTILDTAVKLPTGGVWSNIIMVFEWRIIGGKTTVDIPAYTDSSTVDPSGATVPVECYEVETYMHFFINGEFLKSSKSGDFGYVVDGKNYLPANSNFENDKTMWMDGVRMEWTTPKAGSMKLDNMRYSIVKRDMGIDLSAYFADGKNIHGAQIADITVGSVPGSELVDHATFGIVDGVNFNNEASLVAAIKNNSIVELYKNVETIIDVTGKNVRFVLAEGVSVPKFISQDKSFVDYTEANGYLVVSDAKPEDIKTFTFQFGKNGETITMNSVVGTYLGIPAIYDPASDSFNAEYDEELGEDGFAAYYTSLVDWTVAADGVTLDRLVTADSENVTAITERAAAVRIQIDSNGNGFSEDELWSYDFIETINPNANNSQYDFEYFNTSYPLMMDTEIQDHESGWYKYRYGYSQEDFDKMDLTVAGATYTLGAGVGEIIPWVDMWANITVYTYFQMNYYLPAYSMEAAGVTDVVITSGGNSNLKPFSAQTIDGNTYQRWAKNVGAGETEDHEITVNYTVNGQKMVYTVNFGLPSYANVVMTDNVNYGDTSKTLIMNMVNYASQVNTVLEKPVPALYTDLMTTYGTKYLELYNGLTDDNFLEGGDIYNKYVADVDNTAASKYIDGISLEFSSFEPLFRIKYTEDGEKVVNLKESFGWNQSGSEQAFSIEVQVGNSNKLYVITKVFDAGTNTLATGADRWNSTTAGDKYDYYAYAISNGYTSYTQPSGWAPPLISMDDYAGMGEFRVMVEGKIDCTYKFSVASYVNGLIKQGASETDINLAKCIYAYAQAANAFMGIA